MGAALQRRLKQQRFDNPFQEAMLNILVCAGHLEGQMDNVCGQFGITRHQYNILRILRGAQPDGYPCGEIAARMVHRAPDITRRLDLLERNGYVVRQRDARDRRVVYTRITQEGLDLLDRMDPEMKALHDMLAERIPVKDARDLSRLVEMVYTDESND